MKNPQNPYHFLDIFCLRTPLFSLNFYKKLFYKSEIEFEDLKNIWKDRSIKEALFLASPELYTQLNLLFKRKPTKRDHRIKQAFLKYLIRLSTRCTPFGLFAGVSTGQFEKETNLELMPKNQYSRVTKLDTGYLSSLLNNISKIDPIKSKLLFYPNTSLYKIGNQYRYIEYKLQKTKRSYSVEGFEASKHLEKIFSNYNKGRTIKQLAKSIIDHNISFVEAKDFIEILIENQVLINELEINITGEDTFNKTIKRLKELSASEKLIKILDSLENKLSALDKNIGNKDEQYFKIIRLIKKLEVPFETKYLFQTDLYNKYKQNKINIKHAYTVKKTLPLLFKLNPYRENERLSQFKKAFWERYETREVPLTQVLDIESGIGYIQNYNISNTTPFLENITPKRAKKQIKRSVRWTNIDAIIFNKLVKSQENKEYILELKDEDFNNIMLDWNYLPDTLFAFTELVKIDNKEQLVLKSLNANAGNLLGRFAHGDNKLLEHLKNITAIEKNINPNKVIAEITHLPEARTGNILKRPHIRDYEIPYLAKSTLPKNQQIPIKDLWISIRKDKVVLKSKKLGKEILPKLTNAHNYKVKSLPVYHFLCDLQNQNTKTNLSFSWFEIAEKYNFLPRVIYKNIILSKAKWHLSQKKIQIFIKNLSDSKNLLKLINEWRMNYNIPKDVQLVEGDNMLLIDLENIDSIRLLLNRIKNKKESRIEEFFFSEDSIIKQKGEKYTNECIFTFYNEKKLNSIV